jgi:hypothetical protein
VLHRIWSSSSAGESHPHALTESGRPPARSRLPKPCRSAPRRTARARCPRTRLSREACRAGLSPRPSRVARLLTARHVTSGCRFRAALRRRPAGASVRPRRLRSARWRRWGTATWRGLPPSAPVSACRRLRHAVPLVSAVGGRGSARTGACRRRLAQPPNGATRGGLPLPARNPGRDAREHADRRRAGGALRPRQLRPRTLVLVGACVEPRGGHGPWPPGALADVGGQGVGVDGAAAFHLGPREAAAVLIVQQAGAGVRLATPLVAGAERGEHSPGPLPQAMPVDTAPTASGSRVVRVPAGAVVAEDARRLAGGVCDQGFGLHELARARLAPAGTTACPQRFDCGRGPGNPTPPGLSASRTACPRRSVGSSGAGAGRRRAVCSAARAAAACP